MTLGADRALEERSLSFEDGFIAWEWPGANELPRLVLRAGTPVGGTEQTGDCCYLVERGVVASYVNVDGNRPTCVGLLGPGEIVGLATLFDAPGSSAVHSCAISSVQLLRIPAAELRAKLLHSRRLLDICTRQMRAQLLEIQHVAACNARHLLPARCAHWLLRLHARLGDTLPVTHEFLASVLGVRRAGITVTLQGLQRSGAIRQQRGSIVVTDLDQLRQAGCSCPIGIERPAWPLAVAGTATMAAQPPTQTAPGPRAWLAAAIQTRSAEDAAFSTDPMARIDAVLQVCRSVMEQTQAKLAI